MSNREKILTKGVRVIHERGFGGASVRGIAQAANVPLGSFTNNFPSKEVFGLEVLERYHDQNRQLSARTLQDKSLPVRARLQACFDRVLEDLIGYEMRRGSLIGNFSTEMSGQSELLRLRLMAIYQDFCADIQAMLEDGVGSGELRADLDCAQMAQFIYASMQGALLFAKVLRVPEPVESCRNQILRDLDFILSPPETVPL
ncbi:MAG TPA: TetR family transcriptional regulator C-terminal domain-containing protein [Acidocella sp.]|nr:TetR family transcriptional regulator C-terminal domain-containing protein [Acidocella sp.]